VVWDVQEGRPNSTNHLSHCGRTSVGLDSVPEECSGHTDDDSKASKVPSEGGSHGHREGHVKTSTEDTVENKGDCAAERPEDDADNSFTIGQANRENGRRSFPTLSVQSI